MRYCITGDSLILTDKGIFNIGDISDKREDEVSFKVLSYDGRKNKASRFFDSGKHDIKRVETEQGYSIAGSHNHPLLCWTRNEFGVPVFKWKMLSDVKKGDVALLQRNYSMFSKENLSLEQFFPEINKGSEFGLPKKMTKDLAFALGALVAEGSFHQNKIMFNNSDHVYYEAVKSSLKKTFKGLEFYERDISGGCKEFDLYHQQIVRFLSNIGFKNSRSDKKEIPFSVLRSKKGVVLAFLRGLFEGDGSVKLNTDKRHGGKSIELTYNTKSLKLVRQLKTLLLNFGVVTTKPYHDRKKCYKLIISGAYSISKFKEIGFFSEKKNSVLDEADKLNSLRMSKTDYIPYISDYLRSEYSHNFIQKNNLDRYNLLEKNLSKLSKILKPADMKIVKMLLERKYFFNKVVSVSDDKPEKVYSVKVESDCHSFVANGFLNHNTEARMNKLSEEMLADIDKDTVDYSENFDGSLKEPDVLPSKLPNVLANGTAGIAVGMATNIPPHNLTELCDGINAYIDDPDITVDDMMGYIKGPDFPTRGIISTDKGLEKAYKTGRGKIKIRSKYHVEEVKGKERIIIDEIPYQVNKAALIEQIANLVKDKKINGIRDLRDESDREGMRIVIELKKDAQSEVLINQLFRYSRLEVSYGLNMLALVDNEPRTLSLKDIISQFVKHRKEVITRRTEFELDKAKARAHILEGLITALDDIDEVVGKIKASEDTASASSMLMEDYSLSEKQAKAILDMKLQKLSSLEREKLRDEQKSLKETIAELRSILESESKVLEIIKGELVSIKEKYGDKRKTDIVYEEDGDTDIEELIEEEDVVVTISNHGYIKRLAIDTYRQQRRGGKGVVGATTKEGDFVESIFVANTHSYLMFFTDKGKVYWLKVYNIPEAARQSRGKAIVNLIGKESDENITAYIPVKEFKKDHYLFMATDKGYVKRTSMEQFSRPRRGGIRAINTAEDERLMNVLETSGNDEIILATKQGLAARFRETDVRDMGRTAHGVRGISLNGDDHVVGAVKAEGSILTITANGYGKRTPVEDYRLINRGGKGVINIKSNDRNGEVTSVKAVSELDEILLITRKGIVIRTNVHDVSVIGRNTQGVRLMKMKEDDNVVGAAKIIGEKEEESIVDGESGDNS
ncbi:MAG: DNA gyrase subunit A [Nanobdellota archaeon]